MTPKKLHELIINIKSIDKKYLQELQSLAKRYPYFQAVRCLIAKIDNSSENIKCAAVLTAERAVLKNFIHSGFDPEVNMPGLQKLNTQEDLDFFEKFNEKELAVLEESSTINPAQATNIPKETEKIIETSISKKKQIMKTDYTNQQKATSFIDTGLAIREEVLRSVKVLEEKKNYIKNIQEKLLAQKTSAPKLEKKQIKQVTSSDRNPLNQINDNTQKKLCAREGKGPEKIKPITHSPADKVNDYPILPPVFYPEKILFEKATNKYSIDMSSSSQQKKQKAIIKRFINAKPTISFVLEDSSQDIEQEDLSAESTKIDIPVSENMAKILEKQGKIILAIKIYEELSLKYPDKKVFFCRKNSIIKIKI